MAKILFVDDDENLCSVLTMWLKAEKHAVEAVFTGQEALDRLHFYTYDLIILDWGLPDISGLDVLKKYRANDGHAPVLFLTGKGAVSEITVALDAGADDYLSKPFDMKELFARMRAVMRRPPRTNAEVLMAGSLVLNLKTFQLTKNGVEVLVIPKEFALLEFFMKHPNEVFNIESLMERLWPSEAEASPEVVRTYISRLRQKLEAPGEPSMFQTVHRVGYKFVPPPS